LVICNNNNNTDDSNNNNISVNTKLIINMKFTPKLK